MKCTMCGVECHQDLLTSVGDHHELCEICASEMGVTEKHSLELINDLVEEAKQLTKKYKNIHPLEQLAKDQLKRDGQKR